MRKTWRQRSLTCGLSSLCGEPIPAMLGRLAVVLLWLVAALPACPASYYPQRLEDPRAVYVAGPSGGDDTAALQQAIDRVRETGGQGIVLLGPGRYRINDTLYIWPGIRVIGYGATRPVIVLSANTPGFQEPTREKVMVFFAGGRPGSGRSRSRDSEGVRPPVPDANPGHLLFRAFQHRHRDRGRKPGGGGRTLTLRSALLSRPHGPPPRARHWLASTRRAT